MASLVKRGNSYYVVYQYIDSEGKKRQKWETYKVLSEAKARKKEVEYKTEKNGMFHISECRNLEELLKEYVSLYGKQKWSISTFKSNTSLIDHYVNPYIGKMKLSEITTRVLEKYYREIMKKEAVQQPHGKNAEKKYVGTSTVRDIHKVLRSAFRQAVKWELMEKNPATYAEVPRHDAEERKIWDAETIFRAIDACKDERLLLALHLTFSCSLRIGELLGLTWDCVDISEQALADNCASIRVNKELQRVDRQAAGEVDHPEIILVFPIKSSVNKTELVLKTPKTASSVRRIFLPLSVAEMLVEWKKKQEFTKDALGDEYQDFNLVFAGPLGLPTEASRITQSFKKLIEENDLPPVVFHSLRHSSITYKLKLNGGDVKAVQGDSGHSQATMVTEVYSHIMDEGRKNNARLFEEEFYSGKGKAGNNSASQDMSGAENPDQDMLLKILSNPEMAGVLKAMVNALGK